MDSYVFSVGDFYPALIGLQNTKLEKLHFSSFNIDTKVEHALPEMVILNETFCENLNLPFLTDLHLDHSQIVGVRGSESCFSKLSKLKVLNLQFNCLSSFEIGHLLLQVQMMTNIIEINLSYQYDPMFVRSYIRILIPTNLATLDLSYILTSSENTRNFTFLIDSPTKYLNFQGNFVTVLREFVVLGVLGTKSSIPMEVDFSRNNMISFEGSFDNAILEMNLTITNLILSENQLGEQLDKRGDQIFKYFWDLTKLDLTLNGIEQLPHSTFENLHKLEYLNLSKNSIKQLPYSTFENLHKLEYLNLSKNSLLLITFKISHMRNLKWLDLSREPCITVETTHYKPTSTQLNSFHQISRSTCSEILSSARVKLVLSFGGCTTEGSFLIVLNTTLALTTEK